MCSSLSQTTSTRDCQEASRQGGHQDPDVFLHQRKPLDMYRSVSKA